MAGVSTAERERSRSPPRPLAAIGAAPRPPAPRSCDTFVFVGGGASGPSATIFGKNSDRPSEEEHQVVFVPGSRHPPGSSVKCTYIEIPQVEETLGVVLSKPRWMWGCEMGANERGVVGGNEAVWTSLAGEVGSEERLLGMDILRLALERGASAREAAKVCASLTETFGQGGGCGEDDPSWTYENGYLFADGQEAFVVETCGIHFWAMERVPPGSFRNISNGVSIRDNIFAMKDGLRAEFAKRGLCGDVDEDGAAPFDWKAALSGRRRGGGGSGALDLCGRELAGREHLVALSRDLEQGDEARRGDLAALARRFFGILRDEDSGICFTDLHGFNSTGSQVSWLPPSPSESAQHFFTCASDPSTTGFKRFGFPEAESTRGEGAGAASGGPGPDPADASLELWRARRRLALGGRSSGEKAKAKAAAEVAAAIEEESLAAAAAGRPIAPGELAAACARELAALVGGASEGGADAKA